MIRVDRSKLTRGRVNAMEAQREYSADRRTRNRAEGKCVNENKSGTHGPATHGVRCAACAAKRRISR